VDQPTAHALIAEVSASVAASGFSRIAIVNSSPWSEELCNAAARDLRVSRGLHMFHVHLSALELDFHPVRSRSRRRVQTLLTSLYGKEPEAPAAGHREPAWGDESVSPLGGAPAGLADAQAEGPAILAAAAARLAKLISDIREAAPLSAKLTPA
jgi:creatinine amidohydrolase